MWLLSRQWDIRKGSLAIGFLSAQDDVMMFTNVRRRLRRYRADNPYSHPVLFFFLDTFLGLLKALLVCLVVFAVWSGASALMKQQDLSSLATASTTEEVVNQLSPSSAPVEPITAIPVASVEAVIDTALVEEKIEIVEPAKPTVIRFDDKWVLNQSRGSFTVQLGSSPEKDKLVAFANELSINEQVHIYAFKVSRIGNPIYGLAFGSYPDLQAAQAYIEKLPVSYRQFDPWIRPIGELQDEIVRAKEQLTQ